MALGLLEFVGSIFKPLTDLIDDLTLSPEEKANIKKEMWLANTQLYSQVLEYEKATLEARAKIVQAEAQSESWLTANWRPLIMVFFAGIIGSTWFGYAPPNITPELNTHLFDIIELGLGGYVVGRSVEKIAPAVAEVLKRDK
jgi:hypothetical protein